MAINTLRSAFVTHNALLASRLSKKIGIGLSVHGISLTEYLVMHYLDGSRHGAAARIELADHLGMSASGVTRLLAPMERRGLIDKVPNPRDARQSMVKVSKAGRRLFNDAHVTFDLITGELLGQANDSQLKKTIEVLSKVTPS